MKERLLEIISYFEGTCEICLDNMGIARYGAELKNIREAIKNPDDEEKMLCEYLEALIVYKEGDIDAAYKIFEKALEYAKKANNGEFIAKIHSYYAIYYYVKKEPEKEKEFFDDAKKRFEDRNLFDEIALQYVNILWYKRYDPDMDETREYMSEALKYAKMSDSGKNARVYLHLGYIYKTIFNDFVKGVKYLALSNELCHKYGFTEMESMTFHVLADGYLELSHFDESVRIYEDIFNSEKYKDITPNLKCLMLANLVSCFFEMKDLLRAEQTINDLEKMIPEAQDAIRIPFLGVSKWLRARLYIAKKTNLDEAGKLLLEAKENYQANREGFAVEKFDAKLYSTMGDLYMALGQYDEALDAYMDLLDAAKGYDLIDEKNAYSKLIAVYDAMGDYPDAFAMCRKEDEAARKILERDTLVRYEKMYRSFFNNIQKQEIKDLNSRHEELKVDIIKDELTGLRNRAYYENYMDQHRRIVNENMTMSVLLMDIDCFKQYNDHYGHVKGDECLRRLADCIMRAASEYDAEAMRYGGEEFIVFAENLSKEDSIKLAEKIKANVEAEKIVHEYSVAGDYVSFSIGIAREALLEPFTIDRLVGHADYSNYYVKDHGRNGYHFYDEND